MEELTQIVGFFLGDGFWLDDRVAFSNTNEDLIKHYIKLIKKIGFETKLYKRQKQGNRKDEFTLVAEKKLTDEVKHELESNELDTLEKCKEFLRGIFDAEGNVNFSSTRRGKLIKITNTNKKLIFLVEYCLTQLGMKYKTSLVRDQRLDRKNYFNISLYGTNSMNFIKIVRPYKIWSENYLQGKVHQNYMHVFQ